MREERTKKIKRVAFLSFDWDYEIVAEYYRGMQDCLADLSGLQLVVFSAFGHYHVHYDEDLGARKVFELCNPRHYDGFILQSNRMWPPAQRQEFADRMRELGKPVVSINYDLAGTHVVGTDNYQAMYDLVDRVLTDRACTDPAFVNGLASSKEAQDRARGYFDACAAHGMADPRFYQGSWQIEDARELAHELLATGEPLPEVFFCCNDDCAIGMQEVFQAQGVRVPEDVMFSGFDNREIARCVTPPITTVDRDYYRSGRTALEALVRLLDGEELPRQLSSPVQLQLRASCGYEDEGKAQRPSAGDLYSLDNSLKRFYEVLNGFQSSVNDAESLDEILRACEYFGDNARCPNIFLVMSDTYLHHDAEQNLRSYAPIGHLMAHWGSADLPPCDARHIYASYRADELLPPAVPGDAPMYVVYPLRHGETCIGTIVTEGLSPTMSHGFFTFCLTILSAGISNLRNVVLLRQANAHLDNLYVHDELTGLFNRFGLERFGEIAYEHLLRDFGLAYFIFVDIDDMKGINDGYGHDAGDVAIRETANVIRRATAGENVVSVRYGGDEFLLICRYDLSRKLEEELRLVRTSMDLPFDLSLSIGCNEVRASDGMSLDGAIQLADARMYDIKRQHKAGRA